MRASVEALIEQVRTGKLENDRAKLLRGFITHPEGLCIHDIRNIQYRMMDSTIKARITELLDIGVIIEAGKVKRPVEEGKLRSYTLYKYVEDFNDWNVNAENRRRELFERTIKSLELKYADLMIEYGYKTK